MSDFELWARHQAWQRSLQTPAPNLADDKEFHRRHLESNRLHDMDKPVAAEAKKRISAWFEDASTQYVWRRERNNVKLKRRFLETDWDRGRRSMDAKYFQIAYARTEPAIAVPFPGKPLRWLFADLTFAAADISRTPPPPKQDGADGYAGVVEVSEIPVSRISIRDLPDLWLGIHCSAEHPDAGSLAQHLVGGTADSYSRFASGMVERAIKKSWQAELGN